MFARTLTALLLCAAPALASPPEAPMPRAAGVAFPLPPHPMWYDPEECSPEQLQLWHRMHFDLAHNTSFLSYQAQRDAATRRCGPFGFDRYQQHTEAEYMRRYQEPVRFAPQPPAAREASEPDPDALSERGRVCLPPAGAQNPREGASRLVALVASCPYENRLPRPVECGLERLGGVPEPQPLTLDFLGWKALLRDEPRAEFVAAPPAEPLVCPPCPLPKIEANPLLGTWFREFPGEVVALTVTPDEMKLRVTWAGENAGWATVTAQYTLTKGGLAYGAFTGGNGSAGFTDKMSVMMQMLMDAPFSFRFRFTSEGLMIHHLQTCRVLGDSDDVRYAGLYTRAKDDKVPAPVAKPEPRAIGPPVPPPSAVPSSFAPPPGAPMQAPMPMPPAPPSFAPPIRPAALEGAPAVLPPVLDGPPPLPPKRPNAPPDGLKFAAEDAFGALLQQSGVLPKPDPEPLPLAVPAKKLAHVGTWHREAGPMTCVVKIDAEYVTVTATVTAEENGKKVKRSAVLTGDYHLARDGTALVGLVTGLDVPLTGATGKGAGALDGLVEVTKLQRGLVGAPFALTVRAYGEVLVIGDVRLGEHGFGEMAAMLAGRYKSGEPKAAEPMRLPRATGATVPRIPYADADDHARVKELLYQSETTGPIGARKQKYSSDPNVRRKQLLKNSEDLRQIQNEWRRFWFNDQPSKLTPERVHGGIY